MDTVENYVFANIHELVTVRLSQTVFKKIMSKYKSTASKEARTTPETPENRLESNS